MKEIVPEMNASEARSHLFNIEEYYLRYFFERDME